MKWIRLELNDVEIKQNTKIIGVIAINYPDKYDGVIINTQIFDSNEFVEFLTCNNKSIVQKKSSRIFINYKTISDNTIKFVAMIKFKPNKIHDVKFRVCIIEQHKEITEDVTWAKFI